MKYDVITDTFIELDGKSLCFLIYIYSSIYFVHFHSFHLPFSLFPNYQLGAELGSDDCGSTSICKHQGDGKKSKLVQLTTGRKCAKFASCSLDKNGERACMCNKGYRGNGYKKCKPEGMYANNIYIHL